MMFLNLIFVCLCLIILLILLYHILDRYSWEEYLNSCEQLRQVNYYGEQLKEPNEFYIIKIKKLGHKKRYYEKWYHPIIEDVEYSAEHIFFHKNSRLFNKKDLNLMLKQRKYFENPILFKSERQAQIILSKKDYKLMDQRFLNKSEQNICLHPFSNIRFIDPYFLTDEWSQVFPPCRGVKSCALW
jgi:hypothetical protein